MKSNGTSISLTTYASSAYFGLSGRLFRYHPATCTGVIRPG
jgi:hypothetical protein